MFLIELPDISEYVAVTLVARQSSKEDEKKQVSDFDNFVQKRRPVHYFKDSFKAVSGQKFSYHNQRYWSTVKDNKYTVNIDGGAGCWVYATFVQGVTYGKVGSGAKKYFKRKGKTLTEATCKEIITRYAQAGEHIRIDDPDTGYTPNDHSLAFVSCTNSGLYYMDYQNDSNPYIYLNYTTWKKFADTCNKCSKQDVYLSNPNTKENQSLVKPGSTTITADSDVAVNSP